MCNFVVRYLRMCSASCLKLYWWLRTNTSETFSIDVEKALWIFLFHHDDYVNVYSRPFWGNCEDDCLQKKFWYFSWHEFVHENNNISFELLLQKVFIMLFLFTVRMMSFVTQLPWTIFILRPGTARILDDEESMIGTRKFEKDVCIRYHRNQLLEIRNFSWKLLHLTFLSCYLRIEIRYMDVHICMYICPCS